MTGHTYTAARPKEPADAAYWIVTRDDGAEHAEVYADTAEAAIAAVREIDAFTEQAEKRRTAADFDTLTQAHIDAVAQSMGYRNGDAVASFAVSKVEAWADEARRFCDWRDQVWLAAFAALDAGEAHETFMAALVEAGIDRPAQVTSE